MNTNTLTLEQQRELFKQTRMLAMPLAGTIAWTIIGVASFFLSPMLLSWTLFIATGCIAYLGMFISKFTGENFLDKSKPKNVFDTLFFYSIFMSVLVYAIAIPFFQLDYTSLPLSVGILAGLMWLPLSWIIEHWVGLFHAVTRTVLITVAWYVFPNHRFAVISFVIVAIYLVTIVVLERRWRAVQKLH